MNFEMELNFAYKHLVEEHAKCITRRLTNKFVRYAQGLKGKDGYMFLGEGSELLNLWDEICVDMQGEWSFCHQTFLNHIEQYAEEVLYPTLTEVEKTTLWVQTEDFDSWMLEAEDKNYSVDFFKNRCEDSVKGYIADKIIEHAMDYTNERIGKYLYER